jgi:hypothetical protein
VSADLTCDHQTTVCNECRCRAFDTVTGRNYCPLYEGPGKPCCEGTGVAVIGLGGPWKVAGDA